MKGHYDIIIIGGGAAGFFTAINIATKNPNLSIAIFERGKNVLSKVKVSGGGRCNVTHACFDPSELVLNYPRGEKELLGPFHRFACGDTFAWFEERGILLNIEEDGRVFPISNTSQTIIDCFLSETNKLGIEIIKNNGVDHFYQEESSWVLETKRGVFYTDKLVVTAGSSPKIWSLFKELGHRIIEPVPSLFTFNIDDKRIQDIPGVVVDHVEVEVLNTSLSSEGPLLITHWGLSAPSILKLSAFGARELAEMDYHFNVKINFIQQDLQECQEYLKQIKQRDAKKFVAKNNQYELPKRLWKKLVLAANISEETKWADLNKAQLLKLSEQLTQAIFKVAGKSTFKEEFVTAGGIDLKEIDFKRFESKLFKNLFVAGEVLNIDAITGGFNFQNAWTGGFIISEAITA